MKKIILFLMIMFSILWTYSAAVAAITVGRISYVEGEIYRYMDVDDSWATTFLQSPAGTLDVLLTGENSRAEIVFPNNLLMRLEENTEVEILDLVDDSGEFVMRTGLARFYNKGSGGNMTVETARGTVAVAEGSAVDILAANDSVTVSAVYGEARFHKFDGDEERVEIISGSTSLEFQESSIVAGNGPVDRSWDRWCADRERLLARNHLVRSEHLPESMQEYAHVMEPYGHWQRIYYRGYYYWAWKPGSVPAGWSPYTTGYWYDWQGSRVWIDHNPWGWVTHHHGHWLNLYGAWLWTPYVHVSHVPGVTIIGFNITFGKRYRSHWHPGRVRWIGYRDHVGWLPLAPWETYYSHRKWGPRTVIARAGSVLSININLSNHRHIEHAVVIPKKHFYQRNPGIKNYYKKVRIKNINKKILVKNYKTLHLTERARERNKSIAAERIGKKARRVEIKQQRRVQRSRKTVASKKLEIKKDRSVRFRRLLRENKSDAGKYVNKRNLTVEKNHFRTVENKGNKIPQKKIRKRIVRQAENRPGGTVEKNRKIITKKRLAVRDNSRKKIEREVERNITRNTKSGRDRIESPAKRVVKKERKISAAPGRTPVISGKPKNRKQNFVKETISKSRDFKEEKYGKNGRRKLIAERSIRSRERIATREKMENGQRFGSSRNP